jgi:hypothetical protein
MTSLLDVPDSPSEVALETGLDGSSLEGRIPFAFSRARLGQGLRRLGVGNAVHRSCRGRAAVSTTDYLGEYAVFDLRGVVGRRAARRPAHLRTISGAGSRIR